MKKFVCREFGPPSSLQEIELPLPSPKPHELRVEIDAAGIGFVDGLMIQGLYQVKPPLPYFPGSEFSGVITAIGNNERIVDDDAASDSAELADATATDFHNNNSQNSGFSLGDRVFGLSNAGTLGDVTCAPKSQCYKTPDSMGNAIAAGWYINYLTALYGLRICLSLIHI